MKIIAGSLRGRRLVPVKGTQTRPALEKVRGALFDMLEPDLPGSAVLDLFAGTGSLGLEALSRGARRIVFVEKSRAAQQALSSNIDQLGVAESCRIIARSAFRIQPEEFDAFDLVLADPPFAIADGPEMRELEARIVEHWLAPDGLLVQRIPVSASIPEPIGGLTRLRDRQYGDSRLLIDHRV
jgi:16S rRNA (guanine966-N2)-methyltransferase